MSDETKTPNQIIRETVFERGDELRDELVRLALGAESDAVRLAALKELNDRAYGKPGTLPAHAPQSPVRITLSADDAALL